MSGHLTKKETTVSNLSSALSEDELRVLGPPSHRVLAKKGRPIYLPGEPGGSIHLLESGRIKLLRTYSNGRELILDIVEPKEIFGEMSILYDEPEETVAEALEPSWVWTYPWIRLKRLVRSNPESAWRMVRLIGWRRRKAENRLESMVFRRVPGRLAALLL